MKLLDKLWAFLIAPWTVYNIMVSIPGCIYSLRTEHNFLLSRLTTGHKQVARELSAVHYALEQKRLTLGKCVEELARIEPVGPKRAAAMQALVTAVAYHVHATTSGSVAEEAVTLTHLERQALDTCSAFGLEWPQPHGTPKPEDLDTEALEASMRLYLENKQHG